MAATVTESGFETEVLGASVPTLVDFSASWCPPCQQLLPVIDKISEESDGSYNVVKVDIDAEPELATRYGIQSIPTLLVFREGKPAERLVGLAPEAQIRALLKSEA